MLSVTPRTSNYYCTALLLCAFSGNVFAGETTRVSITSNGTQVRWDGSEYPVLSADGRYMAFASARDLFVHNLLTKQTERVSIGSTDLGGGCDSSCPSLSISANGRYVAFQSTASNLSAGDATVSLGPINVYVYDRLTKQTEGVSVDSNGPQGSSGSMKPSISADGRYVAFQSTATNLIAGDTNGTFDIFVHDRLTKQTTRVSVDSNGLQGNSHSESPSLSANGRYVAFESWSENLVAGDTNGTLDIFVHDRWTKQTERVNVASNGDQGNLWGNNPKINADGRFVAFTSDATNLVPGYLYHDGYDIYVHDRWTKQTERVSVASNGEQANMGGRSDSSNISADGRYVVFRSSADNLVAGDLNNASDIFVHDRSTKQTTLVSVASNGVPEQPIPNPPASYTPNINADGRFVAFMSWSENLVAGDTNKMPDIFLRDRRLDTAHHADLNITTTQKTTALASNSSGAFTYTITNNGPDTVNNVKILNLVSGGHNVSLTPNQGSCERYAKVSLCKLGELLPGSSLTLEAVVKATGNPLSQKITVSGQPVDAVPTNNRVSVSTIVTP